MNRNTCYEFCPRSEPFLIHAWPGWDSVTRHHSHNFHTNTLAHRNPTPSSFIRCPLGLFLHAYLLFSLFFVDFL